MQALPQYATGYVKLVVPSTKAKYYKACLFYKGRIFREMRLVFRRATDARDYGRAVFARYIAKRSITPTKQIHSIAPSAENAEVPDWKELAGIIE